MGALGIELGMAGAQVVEDALLRVEQRDMLVEHRDPPLRPMHVARDRVELPRRNSQQRRLARPVRTAQRHPLRPVDPQRPRPQPPVAERHLHPVQREHACR